MYSEAKVSSTKQSRGRSGFLEIAASIQNAVNSTIDAPRNDMLCSLNSDSFK